MIDIAILYKKDYTAFTLASLLDKSEEYKVHLYFKYGEWDDVLVKWALSNFRVIQCYQLPGSSNNLAKMILHMRRWYMNKPDLMPGKRLLVITGNRIFNPGKLIAGHIPPESYFENKVAMLNKRFMYRGHPAYKNYYDILKIPYRTKRRNLEGVTPHTYSDSEYEEMARKTVDWSMFMLNFEKLLTIRDGALFFEDGKGRPDDRDVDEEMIDAYINYARNTVFMRAIMKLQPKFMPLYMDGRIDALIKADAIGPKDCLNHNIMLRKSWSIDVEHSILHSEYFALPTGLQLATPFELYGNLISKIPLNLRNARLNERILMKSEKQKITSRKLVQTGYKLGKIN